MEAIFPITALTKQQAKVKEAASEDVVRITENGVAAWIFASEEAFERRVKSAVEEALYEASVASVIARGTRDYEEGRYVVGADAARAKLAAMRATQ
ncbi:hypothetical protein [Adlercreutzia sp. ZJ473]|uniref:hypothetical protein n=1 Tax=Adlercreutzia sp. ZJ473 TaxID=2722822 RepID=UPI001557A35D|nr:hypothetical protein [Adlercreutzia sp. ZJ473]